MLNVPVDAKDIQERGSFHISAGAKMTKKTLFRSQNFFFVSFIFQTQCSLHARRSGFFSSFLYAAKNEAQLADAYNSRSGKIHSRKMFQACCK